MTLLVVLAFVELGFWVRRARARTSVIGQPIGRPCASLDNLAIVQSLRKGGPPWVK